jgi:hypothetical protein
MNPVDIKHFCACSKNYEQHVTKQNLPVASKVIKVGYTDRQMDRHTGT